MRFASFLAFPVAAVASVAVAACSSGSSSSSSGGAAATSSSFADEYCSLIEPCCADAGLSTTGSTCHGWVEIAAGQGTYDPAAGSACLSAMQQAQSSPDFCTTLGGNPPACNQVFKGGTSSGTVQPGGACMQDSDCAPAPGGSATCFSQFNFGDGGSSETRTCVQTTTGKAGDSPCIGDVNGSITEYSWSQGAPPGQAFVCDGSAGLYCDATSHACSAFKAAGAACTSDTECGPNGYCDFASGKCTARLAAGSPCGGSSSAQCDASSYCDPSTQVCTARLGNGSACTTGEQCQSNSCVNSKCSGSNSLGLALLCGN